MDDETKALLDMIEATQEVQLPGADGQDQGAQGELRDERAEHVVE